jgi:chemotaxis protein methyltransferase CheR
MNVILSDAEFQQFRNLIHQIAGISLSDAKKQLVSARLAKRLQVFKLTNYGAYYKVLMQDSAELQVAIDMLTTNETYFFREPKHFDFLRDVALPELRGSGPLRVWSGACSTGGGALYPGDGPGGQPRRSALGNCRVGHQQPGIGQGPSGALPPGRDARDSRSTAA